MNDEIRRLLECSQEEVRVSLPEIANISDVDARRILEKYAGVIVPNFVFWMTGAMLFARSSVARTILQTNLEAEIGENHPELLRSFVLSAGLDSSSLSIHNQERIAQMCAAKDGLSLVAAIAAMENTSIVFIPFLEQLSQKCGGTDLRYTQVHGVADINHATECLRALYEEALMYERPGPVIHRAVQDVACLWKAIFS